MVEGPLNTESPFGALVDEYFDVSGKLLFLLLLSVSDSKTPDRLLRHTLQFFVFIILH
jgi:phosphatidylglycerophosphate synthase